MLSLTTASTRWATSRAKRSAAAIAMAWAAIKSSPTRSDSRSCRTTIVWTHQMQTDRWTSCDATGWEETRSGTMMIPWVQWSISTSEWFIFRLRCRTFQSSTWTRAIVSLGPRKTIRRRRFCDRATTARANSGSCRRSSSGSRSTTISRADRIYWN